MIYGWLLKTFEMLTTILLCLTFGVLNYLNSPPWFSIIKILLPLLFWRLVRYFRDYEVSLAPILVHRRNKSYLKNHFDTLSSGYDSCWTTKFPTRGWSWIEPEVDNSDDYPEELKTFLARRKSWRAEHKNQSRWRTWSWWRHAVSLPYSPWLY